MNNQHKDLSLKSALETTPRETAIVLNNSVFRTGNGINTIYEASYYGSPCYVIDHATQGISIIIDRDEQVKDAIIKKFKRTKKSLQFGRMNSGSLVFLFHKGSRDNGISLRPYLYAKYHHLKIKEVKEKNIRMNDESELKNGIIDYRKCNLYDAGGIRPCTNTRDICVICRPDNPNEKYIMLTIRGKVHGEDAESVEYVDYSPELYEMLTSPRYCVIQMNVLTGRSYVLVHCEKKSRGYVIDNLAKFILIYKVHFNSYKKMNGSVKRFIRDYGKLREKYKELDAAHVNACAWNNCFENLVFMSEQSNISMKDDIKYFYGRYRVFTTVNDRGEILIELSCAGVSGSGAATQFFRFGTPEDYRDWQKVFLGKRITGSLQVATIATRDGIQQALTPRGMILTGEANKETARANEPGIWEWAAHRDKLLELDAADAAAFHVWDAGAVRKLSIPMPDKMAVGQPFVAPYGGGYAIITPVKVGSG